MNIKKHRAQIIVSVIWARVESKMFRLQPVMAGVGSVDSLHGGSCLDEEEKVYAVEILRLGVDRYH